MSGIITDINEFRKPTVNDRLRAELEAMKTTLAGVVHNEGVNRHRIDILQAHFEGLCKHLGVEPVKQEQPAEPDHVAECHPEFKDTNGGN